MKRLFYFLSVIVLLCGCDRNQDEMLPDAGQEDNTVVEIGELPEVIRVSMAAEQDGAATRTYLQDNKVLWHNGDAISYFSGNMHNVKYSYQGEDGGESVELNKNVNKDGQVVGTNGALIISSKAVFPYNENITVVYDAEKGVDMINLNYPTTQKYGEKSFGRDSNIMVASGETNMDADLYFRNACGYLVIKLYGEDTNGQVTSVKRITLSSVSGVDKIAGSAVVVADSEAAPVITMAEDASTSVVLDCGEGVSLGKNAENATEFWFCLPPVTFTDGIKITVDDIYGNTYTKQASKEIAIERNIVKPMAALRFVCNAPAATKLWYTRSDESQEPLSFSKGAFNTDDYTQSWDSTLGQFVIEFTTPLTTIKKFAFEDCNVATITMPEGVITIEESAFEGSALREITIPGSMANINVNAFYDCAELESVTFLPSATKTPLNICHMSYGYEWGPFYDTKLTTINLNRELNYVDEDGDPYNPTEVDEGMFYHKNFESVGTVSVVIGPQVKSLSNKMFNYLHIQEIVFPGTLTSVGNNVFEGCDMLTTVTFEPSADGSPLAMGFYDRTTDDDGPFYSCPLVTVSLNRDIDYKFGNPNDDPEGLFGGKTTLTTVTLGEQVKSLSNNMFADAAITEIVIPGSVNTIGNDVFHECTSLTKVTFEESPTGMALTMGYDTNGEAENLFQDNNVLTTLVLNREIVQIQTGVDTNSEGLFGGMPTLTSITLGEQVKTLSDFMFAESSIEELVIPGNIMTIGNSVFEECEKLATITFKQSSDGKELTIGTNSGFSPFYDSPLTTVNLYREMKYPTAVQTASGLFGGKKDLVNLTIGEQVKTLSPYMFAGSGLTDINLNKVETIKDRALSGLALTSLTIPGGVNTIGDSVFAGCNKLVTITFEPSTDGKALAIDSSGGYSPFCNSPLTTLNLNRELKYLIIPDKDTSGMFALKENLTKVTLGDQVKTLSPYMFTGSGLTDINLNKVETIEKRALSRLALTSLTIPGSVKTIGNNVFEECTALEELTFNPNDKGEALKIGFYDAIDDKGPFYDCPLITINLNRELDYDFDGTTPNDAAEGVFGGKESLASVTLGSQVKTLSPFMFAESTITALDLNQVESIGKNALANADFTDLTIPATTSFIDDNAFINCDKLANLTFAANESKELTIGFQPGTNEHGPFWQSPLTNIVVNRGIVYTDAYNSACNASNEGIFSTSKGVENTTISLGSQVTRIPKCMFATLPITSITIPATVTEIGENAFLDCDKLSTVIVEANYAEPITVACQRASGQNWGPFYDSPLSDITVGRNINYVDGNGNPFTPAEANDGFFANEDSDSVEEVNVSLGRDNDHSINSLSPYMFAGLKIKKLFIPKHITNIAGYAFYNCSELSSLIFDSNTTPLTIGFQKGTTDDRGPFYQSPLAFINLDRELVMDEDYTTNCDQWDEGVFSNAHYDNEALTAQIYLGNNVHTILPYMFSTLRMEQLHLPKSIDKIGEKDKNVVERCNRLNAIVFYDNEVRPVVADNAFGNKETLQNYNYFLFMPRYSVDVRENGESLYYTHGLDELSYWHTLCDVMVASGHQYVHPPHVSKGDGIYLQRYYDTVNNKAKPGYEWYVARYCGDYDANTYVDITPPEAPAE